MKHAILTGILLGALGHPAVAQPKDKDKGQADELAKAADAAAELASVPTPDLAKAADATADVANTTGPPPANDAAAKAAAEIDLSALGLDPTLAASAVDDKLNIFGFADISYNATHFTHESQFVKRDVRGFQVGNLNLYLAKNLTARARALAEIRFTLLPNGGRNETGGTTDTTTGDTTNVGRPVQWGGIVIERVYGEYDLTDWLTIRAGRWLTPYGIWNIDHGSPAIIGTSRPYIIGEQFFPEHQTGVDLFGAKSFDGYKASYHLTATNGRGAIEALEDQDNKLAFGVRAELETPWGLRLGGSYYRGRYTGVSAVAGVAPATYKEQAMGGDAQYDYQGFHAQVEVIGRIRDFNGQRPPTVAGDNDFGAYGLVGYRFNALWNVMPFGVVEKYEPSDVLVFKTTFAKTVGLNFRPTGNLILKLQGIHVSFNDDGVGFLAGNPVYLGTAQASFVF